MPISVQRWRRIEQILDGALDLDPDQRPVYLTRTCTGDPGLREDVEAVLRSCDRAGGFLEMSAHAFAEPLLAKIRVPAAARTADRGGCGPLSGGAS
jgi:hypothetical protein